MKIKKIVCVLFVVATICLISSCNKECEHQSTNWIIDVNATCTTKGSKHKECTICHEKLITEDIVALGHDLVHHEKLDATCTEKGHKAYDTCTRCDYTTYEELPALGHTESDWIIDVNATCTTKGSKHKECTICHEKLITEDIVALGHMYENGICLKCGEELASSDLLYELTSDNKGYLVTGLDYSKYDPNALTIIIPNEYMGLPIVGIKNSAFENETKIKRIKISNGVTNIGSNAFSGCTGLTSIVIPNSVTSIGNYAINSERDFRKTQQKISNNIENSLQMIA